MPTIEELRLARAKALAWDMLCLLYEHSPSAVELKTAETWWKELSDGAQKGYVRFVRAIEAADAAMGVVSVPRYELEHIGWHELTATEARDVARKLLSASPLRDGGDDAP